MRLKVDDQKRSRSIRFRYEIYLLLFLCITLNGCATATLWIEESVKTTEITVPQKNAITHAFHSTTMDTLCIHFNDSSEQNGDGNYMLMANIAPSKLEFIRRNFSLPSPFKIRSVSAHLDSFLLDPEKQMVPAEIDFVISFVIPNESGIAKVIQDGRYQDGAIEISAKPSADNRIVDAMTAKMVNRGDGVPIAWLDAKGEVVQDATLFEECSCDQAVKQGNSLLFRIPGKDSPTFVKMPVNIFCKYNCGILQPCTAVDSVTLSNEKTGNFSINLPDSRIRPITPTVTRAGSCQGPDWIELKFDARDAFVFYNEKKYEKEPDLPLAVRIVTTPFAVAVDVVTSPVQIVLGGYLYFVFKDMANDMSGGR